MKLHEALENYKKEDIYPFHMPGHKRNIAFGCDPMSIDITEIEGFDDLHDPDGIILTEQERIATIYESDKSFILVNGSTVGNLAAIYAAVKPGEKLLIARNSHRSVYHGAMVRRANIDYIYPGTRNDIKSVTCAVTLEDVVAALDKNEDVKAVVITSPTYEGLVSPIEEIANEIHKRGAILIVDAAHGAHLGFSKDFPKSPMQQGADITIMSLHKTMPALTQTALLHVKGDRVDIRKLLQGLNIYMTSSPSYVLMSSVSKCMDRISKDYFEDFYKKIRQINSRSQKWKNLHLLQDEVDRMDPSKIVIAIRNGSISGRELSNILRGTYKIETEMSSFDYCIAMTSPEDTNEGIDRLINALDEIDRQLDDCERKKVDASLDISQLRMQKRMNIFDAVDKDQTEIDLSKADGYVAGGFVSIYPPGCPVMVPGELINQEMIELVQKALLAGLHVPGVINNKIYVVSGEK